jgi:hypothetical protein
MYPSNPSGSITSIRLCTYRPLVFCKAQRGRQQSFVKMIGRVEASITRELGRIFERFVAEPSDSVMLPPCEGSGSLRL